MRLSCWPVVLAAAALVACGISEPPEAAFTVSPIDFPGASGSGQPRITLEPDGALLLSWLEPRGEGMALVFSRLVDGAWTAPVTVHEAGDLFVNWADFPSVNAIRDDFWVAHWLRLVPDTFGAYDIVTAVSADRGSSWTEPRKLNDDETETEHGFGEVFAWDAAAGALWLDGRELANWSFDEPDALLGVSLRYAKLDASGAIVERGIVDELVCDCCQPDLAQTSSGPVVAYRDRTERDIRDVVVRRHDGRAWTDAVTLGDEGWFIEGCPVNGPAIAADGADVAVAWFTAADDRPRVRLARSSDAGERFAEAIDIDADGAYGQADLVLRADGSVIVSWWRRAQGGGIDLAVRSVERTGELGAIRIVAHEAVSQPVDVPQLAAAPDGLLVAWTTFDGDGAVLTARVANVR